MSFFQNVLNQAGQAITGPAGQIGSAIGSIIGLAYTSDLPDSQILRLLAATATDVYDFSGNVTAGRLTLQDHQQEFFGSGNGLQYGLYNINDGEHNGEKIIAFRGTDSFTGIVQDFDLAFGGKYVMINQAINAATYHAQRLEADWVTGHSLGACLAECVCSRTRIRGAAFNAPGPWAHSGNSLIYGDAYRDIPFEIHLERSDPISHFGQRGGPDSSHIGKPKWHNHNGGHSMDSMRKDIGEL